MWDGLVPVNKQLPVQEFILSHLNKQWSLKKRHALHCPRQKIINQTVMNLAVDQATPTLIICSDTSRYQEWITYFEEYYGQKDSHKYISELKLNSPLTAFNLTTYSSFCHTMNATADERFQARSYREYELASVGAWDKANDNIGDFDAVKETEVMLNEEAIRQISRYKSKLLRFIELENKALVDSKWLNNNTDQFIRKLVDGNIGLVVCDESNEVTGIWAEALYYVMQSFNSCHSISLSPLKVNLSELSARNFQLQMSLFDSKPLEVKLPLMVRDNCFKPYLGLVAITVPSKKESELLNNASHNLKEVLSKVQNEKAVTITLSQFVYDEIKLLEKDIPGNWAKRRDHVESVLNFISYYSLTPPALWKVFFDKLESVEFSKNLPVIRDYIFRCLLNSDTVQDRRIGEELIMAFRPLGYELNEGKIEQGTSLIPNILNRSSSKEDLLVKYLTEEFINLKRELKAVIITDFIDYSSASEIFPGNDFDGSTCGMISILDKLEHSPITLQLNPIIIYGNTMYFNPKFKTILGKEIEKHSAKFDNVQASMKEESGYCYISVVGTTNFKTFWTPLIQHLLSKKITHTLIVGREFLSDKWDNINFNTYFNLSSATSELFGIRLLARILMKDNEATPSKHLWDFCSIMPEIELGMSDYYRVSRRKEHGWHLCEDGEFEKGISYFHPSLKTKMKTINLDLINEINDTASRLISTRTRTHKMWLAKQDQKNFVREVLEISMSSDLDPFAKFTVSRLKGKKSSTHHLDCKDYIEVICNCIVTVVLDVEKSKLKEDETFNEKADLTITVRRPGVFRIELSNASPEISTKINTALEMLFRPINHQHYVILVTCLEAPKGNILSRMFSEHQEKFSVPFGIPEVFGKKAELSIFMRHWQQMVSNDQMMGHRIPEVRQQVRNMVRKQKMNLRPECRICQLLV